MKNGEKPNLDELLEQITDENRHEEIDFDRVKELIEENKQLKERVKNLKYDVSELEDINFDLKYDIQKLKEQIEELKKENDKLKYEELKRECIELQKIRDEMLNKEEQPAFKLEFDEVPKFIFVSHDGFRNAEIYRNGEKEYGWFKLNLEAEIDEPTVYEISYFACADVPQEGVEE